MNHYVWRMEDADSRTIHDFLPASNQKKIIGPDDELIELMWDNGHVVMHSQIKCRTLPNFAESKQTQKPESSSFKSGDSIGKSINLIQEDEPASWFKNHLDDSLDNGFSELFSNILNADHIVTEKVNKVEKCVKGSSFEDCNVCPKNSSFYPQNSMMIPPKPQVSITTKHSPRLENGAVMNSSRSICGSNQGQNQVEVSHCTCNDEGVKENSLLGSAHNHRQATTFDPPVASLSGGSGRSFGRTGQQSMSNHSHKRKGRDAYDSEVHSEETEYEANKDAQKSAPSRRSRAAEVHNLSERRRRDRINEKMRALQELIPHCNKSDKVSMLDEAIGYLKSLQLQVQIMWMGSGMAPMMFPGVQPYMSHVGIGIGQPPLPSIPNQVQFPTATVFNHSIPSISTTNPPLACTPGISPFNFSNQMANIHLLDPFSHYIGFPQIQLSPEMRDFYTYGSQMMQQNQTSLSVDGKHLSAVEAPSRNIQSGQGGEREHIDFLCSIQWEVSVPRI